MKWCEKRVVVSMKLLMKVVIKGSDDRSGYRIKCGSDNAKGLGKKREEFRTLSAGCLACVFLFSATLERNPSWESWH